MQENNPYQQTYPQYSQQNEIYIPPERKPNFIAAGLIILVLFAAIGIYFAMKPKMMSLDEDLADYETFESPTPEENTGGVQDNATGKNLAPANPELEITKVKLCRGQISLRCEENAWRSFTKGDNFYLYSEISTGINYEDYLTIKQGIKIIDENGNVIHNNPSYKYETIDTYDNTTNIIPLAISIPYDAVSTVGKHSLELTITNTYLGKETNKTITYEIN